MSQTQPVGDAGFTPMQQGGSPSSPPVRPELLGFAFHLAWLCLFMYNVVPGFAGREEGDYNALDPVYFYSMVSLVIVLAFGIWKTHAFMAFARSRAGCYAAPVVCSVGTLFYALCTIGIVPGVLVNGLVLTGGIMTGATSAVMAAHWASVFGKARARAVITNFTLILATVLVACLTVSYLFPTMALMLATLLPLASGASLIYADNHGTGMGTKHGADEGPSRRHTRKAYAILIVAVGLLGLSTGCLPLLSNAEVRFEQIFYSASSVIVLATVGWIMFKEDRPAFFPLFVVPLLVLVVFALPYVRFASQDASGLFYTTGNASIELMLVFEAVLFALLFDFSCARTFMIARVTMALSDMAGWFLAGVIVDIWGTGAAMQVAATALLAGSEVVIGALVVTYLLLRKKNDTGPELNTRAAGVERDEGTSTGGVALTGNTENPTAHGIGMQVGRATISQAHSSMATGENAGGERGDHAAAAVALAVERHGLSPREADVLKLLVAGDSTAQIQDRLCIAPGTFNYHMRNIYAKLGVHSRQELLVSIYNQAKQ